QLEGAREQLDAVGRMFWALTRHVLRDCATFHEPAHTFDLHTPPVEGVREGVYHLISKTPRTDGGARPGGGEFLYRLSHPLGEWAVDTGKAEATPVAEVAFDISGHPTRIADVERLR